MSMVDVSFDTSELRAFAADLEKAPTTAIVKLKPVIKKAGVKQGSVWFIEERDGGYVVVRKPDHQNRLRVTMSPSAWIEFCYLKYLKMMNIV